MRRFKRVFTAVLLAGALTIPYIPAAPAEASTGYADESISDIKEKNAEREKKKKEAEAKLDSLNTEADDIRSVILKLDEDIAEYQGTIDELTTKRNALQAKSSITRNDLQIAIIAKENQYDRMKERIAYSYENGDIHYMDALIALDDFSNLINQSEYVEQVSGYDQKQLSDLIQITKEVADKQALLDKQLAEVEEIKADTEAEQDALKVMQDGKKEKLEEYAGGSREAALKLKSNGSDDYAFTAMFGGYANKTGVCTTMGEGAYFWTADSEEDSRGKARTMFSSDKDVGSISVDPSFYLAVRCVAGAE